MLQRAASNAYSWWWASHIRTKQSKWMEQNLQDMDEKVKVMLKLIEEDGDSFAKRAEMYYKKRPELINFVEESYRAYRSLAERYDHISRELQNANTTIASVFPEQVQFAIDEEDDDPSPKRKPPEIPKPNIPNVPKASNKDLKRVLTTATKKLQHKKSNKTLGSTIAKSGLSKPEAREEIDKVQKQILALQTEKEFVKSSYENGLAKYWEIESQIKEMQERVFSLQDEFGETMVIEDEEARSLMAAVALKSCEETLTKLQEKQQRSTEEARVESKRIRDAREKLESFKNELPCDQINQESSFAKDESMKAVEELTILDQVGGNVTEERRELELLRDKIKEHFDAGSNTSLTVSEMAEKIDELVNKVISLETAVSSQTALVKRLRAETDELQTQIRTLENDKATLINGSNRNHKLKEMEENLQAVQDLNRNYENQNTNLQTHFSEARCNLDHLSEKLQTIKPDEEVEVTGPSQKEEESSGEAKLQKEFEGQEDTLNPDDGSKKEQDLKPKEELNVTDSLQKEEGSPAEVNAQKEFKEQEDTLNLGEGSAIINDFLSTSAGNQDVCQPSANKDPDNISEKGQDLRKQDEDDKKTSSEAVDSLPDVESKEQATVKEDEPNWKQLFMNGLEDREKLLLTEYTTTLRSYKDVKKTLNEMEKKARDGSFDRSVELKELKSTNAMKDEEIKSLRQKISFLMNCLDENKDLKDILHSNSEPKTRSLKSLPRKKEEDEDITAILNDQPENMSAIEGKLRMDIDELLEENLDFWLKFSTSFHQISKFETGVKDLQAEIMKLTEKGKKLDGSSSAKYALKSDARPIYKHLREIQTELTFWLEKSVLLKDELQCRFTSLCNIQEEITTALKESAEDEEFKFTSYQAAKFQGEVLNMKQENNKVADELQAGLDHVTTLQLEVERALVRLNEEFGLYASKKSSRNSENRTRVPLRSFIFGAKPKKQKPSIFSCMSPAMNRKYRGEKAGHEEI